MKRPDRHLSAAEAALWARVAGTVTPIGVRPREQNRRPGRDGGESGPDAGPAPRHAFASSLESRIDLRAPSAQLRPGTPAAQMPSDNEPPSRARFGYDPRRNTLDASWDRKLAQGKLHPDFTLDLHGCSLDAAHARLDHGLTLALAQGARVVLLVTGRPRPADPGGRGERRGAIRAKFLDWLGAGSHASRIAAIRPAHPRHGGAGAVYLVLRRGQ